MDASQFHNKLNEEKTEIIDILWNYERPLSSISVDKKVLSPVVKAKNVGFLFDHRMSLDDEVTAIYKLVIW